MTMTTATAERITDSHKQFTARQNPQGYIPRGFFILHLRNFGFLVGKNIIFRDAVASQRQLSEVFHAKDW